MTATTSTTSHGRHCSHAVVGLSERGALGYIYWPLAAAALFSIGQAQIVVSTVASWIGA
jgi:hypothetical protein